MKNEYSAGGVVFKKNDNYKILLCLQQKLSGAKVFCLPKGHIEYNENIEIAALREVEEEAGITAKIIKPLNSITFFFTQNREKIRKTVYFFLMECIDEHFKPNLECEDIRWCDEDDALKLDPYENEKNIIKEAFDFLKREHHKYCGEANSPLLTQPR